MVYCGKPSRGCQMCRTRRIKCDEGRPTCLQCQKSRRQCPGYKDDFDLVFRNETKATERRARRNLTGRKRPSKAAGDGDHFISSELEHQNGQLVAVNSGSSAAMNLSSCVIMTTPIDQQAPCFFINNFVLIPQNEHAKGYFDFLIPMMQNDQPNSAISQSFRAVAMASMANRPNTRGRDLMAQAIGQYTKALKATNLALQDHARQKEDQTLASVLLLGFFETITSERTNVTAWGSHIDGAVQLVNMRGKKQLRSRCGYTLLRAVRAQMTINCLTASKTHKAEAWWLQDDDDAISNVVKLNLEVTELRAEINRVIVGPRDKETHRKVHDIMRKAQNLQVDFEAWEKSLPDYWRPKIVAWVDNVPGMDLSRAEMYPGKVEAFEDIFVGTYWNTERVSRLLLSGIEVRCAAWISSPLDYRTTPEYASAARLGYDMVTNIISSIAFHLGLHRKLKGTTKLDGFPSPVQAIDGSMSPQGLGGFFCIWPLYAASCSDFTTDSQRMWIRGRLQYISDMLGMNQARILGNYQLRLPSMIVARDNLEHNAVAYAAQRPNIKASGSPATSPTSISNYSDITSSRSNLPLPSTSTVSSAPSRISGPITAALPPITSETIRIQPQTGAAQNGSQSREVACDQHRGHFISRSLEESYLDSQLQEQEMQQGQPQRYVLQQDRENKSESGNMMETPFAGVRKEGKITPFAPYPWLKGLGWVEDS